MREQSAVGEDYPATALSPKEMGLILCVAPHPDDEVIGCGGLLALIAQAGGAPQTVILTDGQAGGGLEADRRRESCEAAARLGLQPPQFWGLQDRALRSSEALVQRILQVLREGQIQWLLLPAFTEPHPDHQAAAVAGLIAARQLASEDSSRAAHVLFYESGAPTQPNVRIDISPVADMKWSALDAFVSQEAVHPYRRHAMALGALRSLGLVQPKGQPAIAAEAFTWLPAGQLLQKGGADLPLELSRVFWPLDRMQRGLINPSDDVPLLSILIRSMNRPVLWDALACVLAQTYPRLELVLVNASGQPHRALELPLGRLPVRVIDAEGREAHPRSEAANLALSAAQGELALFLDDDDLMSPQHLERLVGVLSSHPKAVAAYSDVEVVDADGRVVRVYDRPWHPQRLAGLNHLPIHAVVFRLQAVRTAKLSFDESLPVLEDWHFWLQLARLGPFVHEPGVTARYRQPLGHSSLSDPEHPHYWRRWHREILERTVRDEAPAVVADWLAWTAIRLDEAEQRLAQQALALADHDRLVAQYAERQTAVERSAQREAMVLAELSQLRERHEDLLSLYGERQAHLESALAQQALLQGAQSELRSAHESLLERHSALQQELQEEAQRRSIALADLAETRAQHDLLLKALAELQAAAELSAERESSLFAQLDELRRDYAQLLDDYAERQAAVTAVAGRESSLFEELTVLREAFAQTQRERSSRTPQALLRRILGRSK